MNRKKVFVSLSRGFLAFIVLIFSTMVFPANELPENKTQERVWNARDRVFEYFHLTFFGFKNLVSLELALPFYHHKILADHKINPFEDSFSSIAFLENLREIMSKLLMDKEFIKEWEKRTDIHLMTSFTTKKQSEEFTYPIKEARVKSWLDAIEESFEVLNIHRVQSAIEFLVQFQKQRVYAIELVTQLFNSSHWTLEEKKLLMAHIHDYDLQKVREFFVEKNLAREVSNEILIKLEAESRAFHLLDGLRLIQEFYSRVDLNFFINFNLPELQAQDLQYLFHLNNFKIHGLNQGKFFKFYSRHLDRKRVGFTAVRRSETRLEQELTITTAHPVSALMRGYVGGDCSSTTCGLTSILPNEYIFYIETKTEPVPVGYIQGRIVAFTDAKSGKLKKGFYLHSLNGEKLSKEQVEVSLIQIMKLKQHLGFDELLIPGPETIQRMINYPRIAKIFNQITRDKPPVYFDHIDSSQRAIIEAVWSEVHASQSFEKEDFHFKAYVINSEDLNNSSIGNVESFIEKVESLRHLLNPSPHEYSEGAVLKVYQSLFTTAIKYGSDRNIEFINNYFELLNNQEHIQNTNTKEDLKKLISAWEVITHAHHYSIEEFDRLLDQHLSGFQFYSEAKDEFFIKQPYLYYQRSITLNANKQRDQVGPKLLMEHKLGLNHMTIAFYEKYKSEIYKSPNAKKFFRKVVGMLGKDPARIRSLMTSSLYNFDIFEKIINEDYSTFILQDGESTNIHDLKLPNLRLIWLLEEIAKSSGFKIKNDLVVQKIYLTLKKISPKFIFLNSEAHADRFFSILTSDFVHFSSHQRIELLRLGLSILEDKRLAQLKFQLSDDGDQAKVKAELSVEQLKSKLKAALENEEIMLNGRPKRSLRARCISAFKILLE